MLFKMGCLAAAASILVFLAAYPSSADGLQNSRMSHGENHRARVATGLSRPSAELMRAWHVAARASGASPSRGAVDDLPRVLRDDGICLPTKEQMQICFKTCSSLDCVDNACAMRAAKCGDPGCCRTSATNGTQAGVVAPTGESAPNGTQAGIVTQCYKDCCFALDAGFNFVTPSPCVNGKKDGMSRPASSSKKSCFPRGATVELESGAVRSMDELRVGDRVKVAPDVFSDVFMFTHKLREAPAEFVVVRTESGHAVRLTAGHYIHANGALLPAGSLEVGDMLTLSTGAHSIVVSLSRTVETGLFNPQTLHGDIVVDGIVASTYTTAVRPPVAHVWLVPLRSLYSAFGVVTVFEDGADNLPRALFDWLLPLGQATKQFA